MTNDDNINKELASWMDQKFREWCDKQPRRRRNQRAFAWYLDIPDGNLRTYLNGSHTPTGNNLVNLGRKLGYEVYTLIGMEIPNPDIRFVETRVTMLEDNERDKKDLFKLVDDFMKSRGYPV